MISEHINHEFLDGVVAGEYVDHYYHFGVASDDALLESLRDVRAVVLGGSGDRMVALANRWSGWNGGAPVLAFPKEDRFVTRYTAGVLFASHGMGMPSAAIAVQELMRMLFFLKGGDEAALDEVFWARVGTSGGVGLPGGSVVVTTEALMADLRPYRVLTGSGEQWFDGRFPAATCDALAGPDVVPGKTVSGNEFFLEQFRLDGAIRLTTDQGKREWLEWIHGNGVRNIEMEGAMFAGYLNHWGFPRFAMVCVVLLDRLRGDQVTLSPEQLRRYDESAGAVVLGYLRADQ